MSKYLYFKKLMLLLSFSLSYNVFSSPLLKNVPENHLPEDLKNQSFIPKNIIQLSTFNLHHVLIAEKSTHKVHLYSNQSGKSVYVKSFNAATGKRKGNKFYKGDLKTPEGIFFLNDFIPRKSLIEKYGKEGEIYGAGAFVSDYPNPIDKLLGKTGGGIWLHSTNDNSRINKGLDSRGCVVVVDEDLKEMGKYIELKNTALIIVQDLNFLSGKTLEQYKEEINSFLMTWLESWKNENFNQYISSYHQELFRDPIRGKYQDFLNYKKAVFSMPGKPEIDMSDVSILAADQYVAVKFTQHYVSNTINDFGIKTLFLKRDNNYDWKIVSESWRKAPEKKVRQVAFTPSNRFFEE